MSIILGTRPLRSPSNLGSFRRADGMPPRRAAHDFYPTPPEATHALLSEEVFHGSIWEPACGDGAIARVLQGDGYQVVSTDLIDRGFGIGGIDFLKETRPRARNIVTNPPYGRGLADSFVAHALNLTAMTGGSVAMLLNLASLCHPSRHVMWVRRPPTVIYGLDELICWPNGNKAEAGYRTAQHRYCWAVWRPEPVTRPAFWWLSTAAFRDAEGRAA